jgi:hypothetical protein
MNKDRFRLEEESEGRINIRDIPTGVVLFTILIIGRKLDGIIGSPQNPLDPTLRDQARSFAEREARARGLID